MSTTLTGAWGDLDDVIAELRQLGDGLVVDVDPAKVRAPGVWVRVDGLQRVSLGGHYALQLRLHLVARDVEFRNARDQLTDLADLVAPLIDSYGGPTTVWQLVGLQLPQGPRLPALAVSVDIETE